jgi:hypothetical protein
MATTTAKAKSTEKPLIQIDDVVREMTDEEYAIYQEHIASLPVTTTVE